VPLDPRSNHTRNCPTIMAIETAKDYKKLVICPNQSGSVGRYNSALFVQKNDSGQNSGCNQTNDHDYHFNPFQSAVLQWTSCLNSGMRLSSLVPSRLVCDPGTTCPRVE